MPNYPLGCGCDSQRFGPLGCDVHAVPTVCICAHPLPDAIGECQRCWRPYKPQLPGFDACREAWTEAWRNALLEAAA